MNLRSVLLSGLVAGVIILVSGVSLAHFVLGKEYVDKFVSRLPAEPGVGMMIEHTMLRLSFGLLAVFVYAGFRPRFGPGPKTALIVAGVLFLTTYVPMTLSLKSQGVLEGRNLLLATMWSVGEIAIATLVGARLYREIKR